MAEEKRVISVDGYEHRLMVAGHNDFRNDLLAGGKPTEDVDVLLLKVIDAPTASSRTPYRSLLSFGQKLTRSVAPPSPTEPSDSAGTPGRKRKADREAR